MPYNHFDYVPSTVSHNRSVFKFDKAIAAGGEIGYLYPMCAPVRMLPGSSLKLNLAMEVRTGALIAPLQDELVLDCFAFKVPNRIVWEHWKQFVGATDDVLFDNLTEYQIPHFSYCGLQYDESDSEKTYLFSHLLASWFELPYLDYRTPTVSVPEKIHINALPFRGYNFIWNSFFRPEQLVNPILFSKTDDGWSGDNMQYGSLTVSIGGSSVNLPVALSGPLSDTAIPGGVVLPTFRVHKSLWTSCLPKPSLETLNLLGGLSAPVGVFTPAATATANAGYGNTIDSGVSYTEGQFVQNKLYSTDSNFNKLPIQADLNQALLTVNNYRETIMLQNYYDALNRAGSRYDELLRNLFHVNSPEAVIDIPELIVHKRFTIYRKDVVATASSDYGDSNIQMLGSQGAYIDTVVRDSFFTTSMTEHGFVHTLFTVRPARIRMANGIDPMWTQLNKFDQYYQQFDGMGDVARLKKEIFVPNTPVSGDLTSIFGYQEYGAEYKYTRNSAGAWCSPYTPNPIAGLTLCEKLSAQPTLAPGTFGFGSYVSCLVEEDAFAKCLAISNPMVAPQFIVDIRLVGEIVHPMPVYNIPGMGDLL